MGYASGFINVWDGSHQWVWLLQLTFSIEILWTFIHMFLQPILWDKAPALTALKLLGD